MKGIQEKVAPIGDIEVHQSIGTLDGLGLRFGLVVARFNNQYTDVLAQEAIRALEVCGVKSKQIELVRVPGAYEVPVLIEKMAAGGKFDALIALGLVVEGETQHAQMIIDTTGASFLETACRHDIPVINEIVGVHTWEQADERCRAGETSRGWYAGLAAVETARVLRQVG